MKGKIAKSIADSLTRIIKFNYKDVVEDQIIIARVISVYGDILDTETFGTMDCYDEKNKIEITDIPLNAHINDDGTSGISGTYQFPKVESTVCLALDIGVNKETFIPILFSHIDRVYESYDEEKITKVIEVDTPNPNKPYETTPTGNESEEKQTATEIIKYVTDGTDEITITTTAVAHSINTGEHTLEPSVLGLELKTILTDLSSAIKSIVVDIPSIGLLAPSGAVTGQASGSINTSSQNAVDEVVSRLDDFILTTFTIG